MSSVPGHYCLDTVCTSTTTEDQVYLGLALFGDTELPFQDLPRSMATAIETFSISRYNTRYHL